jgi:hypothetical protein
VIMTLIVSEALHVGTTTVEETTLHRVVIGQVLPTAVKVYNIFRLLMYNCNKTNDH